jgi:hypothetical protein
MSVPLREAIFDFRQIPSAATSSFRRHRARSDHLRLLRRRRHRNQWLAVDGFAAVAGGVGGVGIGGDGDGGTGIVGKV